MKIIKPEASKAKNRVGFLILLLGLAVMAGGIYFYIQNKPEANPPFQITNFIGSPQVYSQAQKAWVPAVRGQILPQGDRLKTAAGEDVELILPGKIKLRLKENSTLEDIGPEWFTEGTKYRLKLHAGVLLGKMEDGFISTEAFEVLTPISTAVIKEALFRIEYYPENQKVWAGVLQGEIEIRPTSLGGEEISLHNLERFEATKTEVLGEPTRISRDEWEQLKEVYELIQKTAEQEAAQLDLSKEAGSLFEYVFDHGTFFMPKVGFADREFVKDPSSGEVLFNIYYDVFPPGSYVGVYIKTRNFDISKFESLQFELRALPGEENYPDGFRMELKDKGQAVRVFAPKVFKQEWRTETLNFQASKAAPVQEITMVFSHEQVGESKKGALQIRNMQLIPKPVTPETGQAASPAASEAEAKGPGPTSVPVVEKKEIVKPKPAAAPVPQEAAPPKKISLYEMMEQQTSQTAAEPSADQTSAQPADS